MNFTIGMSDDGYVVIDIRNGGTASIATITMTPFAAEVSAEQLRQCAIAARMAVAPIDSAHTGAETKEE